MALRDSFADKKSSHFILMLGIGGFLFLSPLVPFNFIPLSAGISPVFAALFRFSPFLAALLLGLAWFLKEQPDKRLCYASRITGLAMVFGLISVFSGFFELCVNPILCKKCLLFYYRRIPFNSSGFRAERKKSCIAIARPNIDDLGIGERFWIR